jgi:hypothetical protein
MPRNSRAKEERARTYGNVTLEPHHSLCVEVGIELVMLAASCMFIGGSLCFFSGEPFQVLEIGEILFMIASGIYVAVGMLEMCEMCMAEHEDSVFTSSSFQEQITYLISAIIFAIGSVLYWPGIYGVHKNAEKLGEDIAAWCFVIGSMGFVIASFWNAVQLSEHPEDLTDGGTTWRRLTKMGLFCSIMGGVLFVTGSYLFSLDVEEGCASYDPVQLGKGSTDKDGGRSGKWCVGVTDQGTILFVIGSVFYTVTSIFNCIKLCMRRFIRINKEGYCEVGMEDDDDIETDRSEYE